MHVLHIALGGCLSAAPPDYGVTEDTGGHIAYLLGATEALAERDDIARIDIVTRAFSGPDGCTRYKAREERLDDKRRIIRLPGISDRYLEKSALEAELPALQEAFLRHLEGSPRPDVIHAHFGDAAALAIAARAQFGIPFLFSSHSLGLRDADAALRPDTPRIARERAAIAAADAIICSSRDEAEGQIAAYSEAAAGRTHRVPPGVSVDTGADPARARDLIHPFLRAPDKPVILAIARPVEKKNLRGLVEAYAGSEALQEAANLVILAGQRRGIGGQRAETGRVATELFDLVDRADLWGKVALPRRHSGHDVQALYALAARGGVFANPALHEPFGLTVVEALQHGVPVVATRNGGPREILQEAGYGAGVDPRDPAGIAHACLRLIGDSGRALRIRRARDHARRVYSWPAWAAEVSAIMRAVAPRSRVRIPERSGTDAMQDARPLPRRLLVSDIDGTLTGDRAAIPRFRDHLAAHAELGFVVATGRAISEARRVLAQWDLPQPEWIVSSVGSEIWRRADGRTGAYVPVDAYARSIDWNWQRAELLAVLDASGAALQAPHEQRRFKLSALGDGRTAVRLDRMLRRRGLRARVVPSHGRFIDVLPHRAGKAAAAAWLACALGLSRAECIAAGDSGNDRDLLAWAPVAILPANAHPEIDDLAGPTIYRARAAHAGGVLEGLAVARGDRGVRSLSVAAE